MAELKREVLIRPFRPKDADVVGVLIQELALFHGDEARCTPADLGRHAIGGGRISTLWVAVLDDEPCGFAATYDWMNYVDGFPVRVVDLLGVREAARRRGVGRALLGAVAVEALEFGCRRITVGAEADNEGANAFYSALGFALRRPSSHRYVASGEMLERLASAYDAAGRRDV